MKNPKILRLWKYKNFNDVSLVCKNTYVEIMHGGFILDILTHKEAYDLIHEETKRLNEFSDKLNIGKENENK